jgi:hypothetical protein
MRMHLLLIAVVAACAHAPPAPSHPGSRGMRADAHLDAAREHARRSAELESWPETRPDATGEANDPKAGLWYRRLDTKNDYERLSQTHRAQAVQLYEQFDEACATIPSSEVGISPLQRYGRGGANLTDGVVIFLDPAAGPRDRLLVALRCHRAWMMLGESGMDDCPLDLADLDIAVHGDPEGVSVEITTANAALVPELQRRSAVELDRAARRDVQSAKR